MKKKEIKIKSILMQNFKTFESQFVELGEGVTSIFGQNARGKSSIADAESWVLFNKSSTGNAEGTQFRPRRYDRNGNPVDHVDVVVEMVLVIDGEETKIRKTQRQNWVRHHGADIEIYEGDKTLFEWNDVPVTATEHKKKVEKIISEEVFRMISNPSAFPNLPVKKQREFLLKNVANITDEDVFELHTQFADVKEAMKGGTLEELTAKTKKEITSFKKKQEEIPIRIDQESKRIFEVDFEAKEKELKALKAEVEAIDSRFEDVEKEYSSINTLKREKAEIQAKMQSIEFKMSADYSMLVSENDLALYEAKSRFNHTYNKQLNIENALKTAQKRLKDGEESLVVIKNHLIEIRQRQFDEKNYICPTCNQTIPLEQQEEIFAKFESKKRADYQNCLEAGNVLSKEITTIKEQIASYKEENINLQQQKIVADQEFVIRQAKLDELKDKPVVFDDNEEYKGLKAELERLTTEINAIDTSDADSLKKQLKAEKDEFLERIDDVKKELALKEIFEKSKETIEDLKLEMKQVTQNLADCERLESQIEKFNKVKMNLLSERINDKFKIVKWKLFEKQKNGGIAETCVCMVNGSTYGENTTSATERMVAGMDIIRTLQDIYKVKAPIFLDDADLYNPWNVPEMECQLIKLCVSEDKNIRIEVES